MAYNLLWLGVVLCASSATGEWYDTYFGTRITEQRRIDVQLNRLVPYCAMEVDKCSIDEPRRLDASCNNIYHPTRGAILTPYARLLPSHYPITGGLTTTKKGMPLPNARRLRTTITPDANIPDSRFTNLVGHVAVTVASDSTTAHDTFNYVLATRTCCVPGSELDPRCMPIEVPEDDPYLRNTPVRCLNLTRTITYQRLGCIPETLPPERVNLATTALDLQVVYGSESPKALRVREMRGGRLTAEKIKGKDWPPGDGSVCLQNQQARNETRCHNAESSSNVLIGVNLNFLWMFRQHNYLADQLAKVNPCWDDDKLYTVAKDINIAIWQNIVYYDFYPNLIDYNYLVKEGVIYPGHDHVDDYDPGLEPLVFIDFVITLRWFHTLHQGTLNLYDNHGKLFNQLKSVELILRTGILPLNNTIEGLTQGSFRQPCAQIDHSIDTDFGERILGPFQMASDVMASDIMKGRDAGLPPYNKYRKICNLPVAKDFDDLLGWMPKYQVESLKILYDDVDDIELMAGILSETPMLGALPPTLACITVKQLARWRRSDRFWFENTSHAGKLTPEQLREVRKMTMSKVLCDHGDTVDAIQYNAFRLPGHGNEIIPCTEYRDLNIEAWRDNSCAANHEAKNYGGGDYEEYYKSYSYTDGSGYNK